MYKDLIVRALKHEVIILEKTQYIVQEQYRLKRDMPEQTGTTLLVILFKDHQHFLSGKF